MAKQKVGLQKEISKIFTGIQIPKKDTAQPKPGSTAPAPTHYIPQKPSVPAPKPFTIPEPTQETPATPKQPAYSAPKPAVYEPQAPKQAPYQTPAPSAYESPKPPAYEPTILPPVSAKDLKVKSGSKIPGLMLWLKIQDFIKVKLLAPKPGVSPLKQKAMIVLTPVLMLVFVAVMANMFLKSDPAKTKPAAKASSAAAAAFDGKINWELPPPYPQNLRDPTTFGSLAPPIVPPPEIDNGPVVKGIVFSEDNPIAVVNDRIVSVGDVVDGAKVVKINRDSVEFSVGDKIISKKVER